MNRSVLSVYRKLREAKEEEEEAFNILNRASSSRSYDEATGNTDTQLLKEATRVEEEQAPAGDTLENNVQTSKEKANQWTPLDDVREAADTFATLGKSMVSNAAKTIGGLASMGDTIALNNLTDLKADKLLDYVNGKTDQQSKLTYLKLKNIAEREDRQDDADLQNLYRSITNRTFKGNTDDIQSTLERSQQFYNSKFYDRWVQPSVDVYNQQKEYNTATYGNGAANFLMNTVAGDVGGPVVNTVLTAGISSLPAAMGLQGSASGSDYMRQRLEQGEPYSKASAEVPFETAKGVLAGEVFQGISGFLSNLFPIAPNVIANIGRNVGIGAASGYGTTVSGKVARNIYDTAQGREVTSENWQKAFWDSDVAMATAISAILYGTTASVRDAQTVKVNRQMAEEDLKKVMNDLIVGREAMRSPGLDIETKRKVAEMGFAEIELMKNMQYEGIKTNPAELDKLTELWKAAIPPDVSYNPNILGAASTSIVPTTQAPANVAPATSGVANQPINYSAIPNNLGVALPNNQTYNGITNTMINEGDVINGGQINDTIGSTTRAIQELQTIMGEYKTGKTVEELTSKEVTNLNKSQTTLKNTLAEKGIDAHFFENTSDTYTAFSTRDGEIWIDNSITDQTELDYIAGHEMTELMLLNNTDAVVDKVGEYVAAIHDNEDAMAKYFMNRLASLPANMWEHYNTEQGLYELAKEVVCDISATNNISSSTDLETFLRETFGDDVVTSIANGMKEIQDTIDFSKTSVAPNTPGEDRLPTFPKTRKVAPKKKVTETAQLEQANNNLRNELVKKDDEIQATEMWSKRTERNKLNKKLDTAQNKLEKTRYDSKEKLKATKQESKEKLSKLTSKKNQEKAEAVSQVKQQSKETVKGLKAKAKEDIKEAKLDAKATDTKKKMNRATSKLEKSLTNVYDKPESKELNNALETLKKSTRGATKLVNKVRGQIPKSMDFVIDDINEILDTYYTGANQMTPEKKATLEKKAAAIEKFAKDNPTIPISKKALEIIKDQNKKSLSDLNPKDLVDLAENVQTIALDIRDAMSFTRANEDAIKLRQEALDFVKKEIAKGKGRTKTPTVKLANKTVEFMRTYNDFNSNIDRIVTKASGGDPNSPLNFISDRLREGTANYFKFEEELLKYFEPMVKVQKLPFVGRRVVNKLDYVLNPKNKLKMKLKTAAGKDYTPSLRDAISIVLGRKDLQFAGHTTGVITGRFVAPKYKLSKSANTPTKGQEISGYKTAERVPEVSEGGYAILANQADAINGNTKKGLKRGVRVKLTNEIVDKMQKELENIPAAKELMDIYSNSGFLKTNARITNDAYEAITGMSIDERENYFPVASNTREIKNKQAQNPIDEQKAELSAKNTLLNISSVKPVIEGADGSIYIYPIDEVINKMIKDATIYGAFATELYDIDTFLNATDEEGITLKEYLDNLDPSFLPSYNQVSNAIIKGSKGGMGLNPLSELPLVGNYTGSILNGNIFLALKQVASLPTAAPFFKTPIRSMLQGIFNKGGIEKEIRKYYKAKGIDVSKMKGREVFDKFFQEATTELETRKRGNTLPARQEILKYANPLERISLFNWYKGTDAWTVNTLAYSMLYDTLNYMRDDFGNEEYIKELGSQFIKMHYATQPNQAPYTRTLGQLSNNPIARAFTFMADPRLKQLNTAANARQHYKWAKQNGTKEDKRKYGGELNKVGIGALAGLGFMLSLNELQKKLKDKDSESSPKEMLTSVIANAISIYAIGFDLIINRALSPDYDFDVSIPDTEVLNKIYEAYNHGSKFVEHMINGEDKYYYNDIKKLITDISYITGIPVKNLYNDMKYILGATDNPLYYEMVVKEDTSMYNKYLENEETIDGDYETYYEIYKATRDSVLEEEYEWIKGSESDTYNSKGSARTRAIKDALGYPMNKELKGNQQKEFDKWYEIFK